MMATPTILNPLHLSLLLSESKDPRSVVAEFTGANGSLDEGMDAEELYSDIGQPLLQKLGQLISTSDPSDDAPDRDLQGKPPPSFPTTH
jgi:hypothetical protein